MITSDERFYFELDVDALRMFITLVHHYEHPHRLEIHADDIRYVPMLNLAICYLFHCDLETSRLISLDDCEFLELFCIDRLKKNLDRHVSIFRDFPVIDNKVDHSFVKLNEVMKNEWF